MATSHKRETARRTPRAALLAGSLAALATGAVVTAGVVSSSGPEDDLVAVDRTAAAGSIAEATREGVLSRSAVRTELDATQPQAKPAPSPADKLLAPKAVAKAIAAARTKRWTTTELNLWDRPDQKAKQTGVLDEGKQVLVTGRQFKDRAEIVLGGKARWVTAGYFSDEKPAKGLSMAPCPDGSSLEAGLQPGSIRVYRAVCAAFPELSSYGGQDGHGEHVNGEAIDFMVPSSGVGERVKDFLFEHRYELNLFDIIWSQRIWTIERDGEGFRGMSDRGSATANHFDHVHIKIN